MNFNNPEETDLHLIHTYNRKIVLESGNGMYVTDINGKKYLDMGAGIAVNGLGYGNKAFVKAVSRQLKKLVHISNLYYTPELIRASYLLANASGMSKVFFTNSGTESIEGALKLARKYKYEQNLNSKGEIIAFNSSFHGRSMGALSVTGTEHYRTPFEPLIPGVKFAEYNNLDSVKALITPDTCAVIMESLQGEGGIHPASLEFMQGIRKLCDENDIVMILDEIQCGMGRTGKMFCYQNYGIEPDVITIAKALGGGVPVGAFAAKQKFADAMIPGDHGTTFGGNPLAMAAVCAVFDIFEDEKIVEGVAKKAPYLQKILNKLKKNHPSIVDVRGMGFMMGLEFDSSVKVGDVVDMSSDAGLLVIAAANNTLRIVPPLIAGRRDISRMYKILDHVIGALENNETEVAALDYDALPDPEIDQAAEAAIDSADSQMQAIDSADPQMQSAADSADAAVVSKADSAGATVVSAADSADAGTDPSAGSGQTQTPADR